MSFLMKCCHNVPHPPSERKQRFSAFKRKIVIVPKTKSPTDASRSQDLHDKNNLGEASNKAIPFSSPDPKSIIYSLENGFPMDEETKQFLPAEWEGKTDVAFLHQKAKELMDKNPQCSFSSGKGARLKKTSTEGERFYTSTDNSMYAFELPAGKDAKEELHIHNSMRDAIVITGLQPIHFIVGRMVSETPEIMQTIKDNTHQGKTFDGHIHLDDGIGPFKRVTIPPHTLTRVNIIPGMIHSFEGADMRDDASPKAKSDAGFIVLSRHDNDKEDAKIIGVEPDDIELLNGLTCYVSEAKTKGSFIPDITPSQSNIS